MKLSLRILSGSLAGQRFEFADGPIRIGRRPDLELTLDPDRDLAASALHAELSRTDDAWSIRDLESSNGTFVDGRRIDGVAPVRTGSRITFGTDGPEAEVRLGDESDPGVAAQVRSAVKRETRRLRTALLLSGLALVALFVAFLVPGHFTDAGSNAEQPVSDMSDSFAPATTPPAADAGAPPPTEPDTPQSDDTGSSAPPASPAQENASTSASPPSTPPPEAATRPQEQAPATRGLNFTAIRDTNGRAVAYVYVETADGELLTGSAFAVRPDGLLLTVRHLVLPDAEGPPPARIGVQFANSSQVFPARLVATSTEEDLAALRVERLVGEVPVVGGVNTRPDTLDPGVPVAMLGVHRTERAGSSGSPDAPAVQPLLRAGILASVNPARLEVHGYGEPGVSGSPVFDSAGQLVGVLYGGLEGGPNQVLLVVNPSRVARFLERIPD